MKFSAAYRTGHYRRYSHHKIQYVSTNLKTNVTIHPYVMFCTFLFMYKYPISRNTRHHRLAKTGPLIFPKKCPYEKNCPQESNPRFFLFLLFFLSFFFLPIFFFRLFPRRNTLPIPPVLKIESRATCTNGGPIDD